MTELDRVFLALVLFVLALALEVPCLVVPMTWRRRGWLFLLSQCFFVLALWLSGVLL